MACTAVSTKVVQKKRKRVRDNAEIIQPRLEMAGNMDSELFLKFIGHFPDYLIRFYAFFGQPLSKQLYSEGHPVYSTRRMFANVDIYVGLGRGLCSDFMAFFSYNF